LIAILCKNRFDSQWEEDDDDDADGDIEIGGGAGDADGEREEDGGMVRRKTVVEALGSVTK